MATLSDLKTRVQTELDRDDLADDLADSLTLSIQRSICYLDFQIKVSHAKPLAF